ncbi:MAG: hypothetical protein E4H00_02545 [Myxococcales bacterium]|nr:MAG: hypothetical protein E4H00_02545 [Myxococcales bacterium]
MPYRFIPHDETGLVLQLQEGETQIERGTPNPLIDGFGHYFFSLPSKLVLLNWKVDNHDVSPELEASLAKLLTRWGQC